MGGPSTRFTAGPLVLVGETALGLGLACGDDPATEPPVVSGDASAPDAQDSSSDVATPQVFGLDMRPKNSTCLAPARPPDGVAVKLEQVFADMPTFPSTMLAQIPGDKTRIYLAAIHGQIAVFPKAAPPTDPPTWALTVPIALQQLGEGGLFGFAFHPKFATNGFVYLFFSAHSATSPVDMRLVVARMKSNDNGVSFGGYTEVLSVDQVGLLYNFGGIAFGPDGGLFVSFNDGGTGDALSWKNGQSTTGHLSKVAARREAAPHDPRANASGRLPQGRPRRNCASRHVDRRTHDLSLTFRRGRGTSRHEWRR